MKLQKCSAIYACKFGFICGHHVNAIVEYIVESVCHGNGTHMYNISNRKYKWPVILVFILKVNLF